MPSFGGGGAVMWCMFLDGRLTGHLELVKAKSTIKTTNNVMYLHKRIFYYEKMQVGQKLEISSPNRHASGAGKL